MVADRDTQEEVGRLRARLTEGGQEGRCGGLTNRHGLSWQTGPRQWLALANAPDASVSGRAFDAMLTMKTLDNAAMQGAYAGPATSLAERLAPPAG
jgi:predicted 3-demethylubiquinone-9 3-methyltransferase (glyoxalase superfamily)